MKKKNYKNYLSSKKHCSILISFCNNIFFLAFPFSLMCFVMILDLTVEIIGNLMIKEERSGKYLYIKCA